MPPSTTLTTCSVCRAPIGPQGECLSCLLRAGLGDELSESGPRSLGFGDYEILRREDGSLWELGCGAMGVTYRARDKILDRIIALKVIDLPANENASTVRARFLREARAAAALKHPNVAGIYQGGAAPESAHCFYAMELVEGETLEALVRREGPLSSALALEIGRQVAHALVAAAAQGLIHRDLKPGNIMIVAEHDGSAPVVKVIDFGLAKVFNGVAETDLTHGHFVGTPSFASPEQFDQRPADARSDLYALGVTLWYTLTGEVPYPGRTIEDIRQSQQQTPLPVAQLRERKVAPPLIVLLRRILALDPAQRPASARELLAELETCRTKLQATQKNRAPRLRAALATAALFCVAALSWWWLRPPPRSPIVPGQTSDLTAFALYQEAQSCLGDVSPAASKHGEVMLKTALQRAPKFVDAYCALARIYSWRYARAMLGAHNFSGPKKEWEEVLAKVKSVAPDAPQTHLEEARYYLFMEDFARARTEAGAARQLRPNDAETLFLEARIDRRENLWEQSLAEAVWAHELDPRYENGILMNWLAEDYQLMRRYAGGEVFLRDAMAEMPDQAVEFSLDLADLKLCEGDLRGAEQMLEAAPAGEGFDERFQLLYYRRDYKAASRLIRLTAAHADGTETAASPSFREAELSIAEAQHDQKAMQTISLALLNNFQSDAKSYRIQQPLYFAETSKFEAGLGRKADALRDARTAVFLLPISKDPLFGAKQVTNLAQVCAQLGERDQAIATLESVAKIPSTISYGNLRFSPEWDSLRGAARFEKMVAALKPSP